MYHDGGFKVENGVNKKETNKSIVSIIPWKNMYFQFLFLYLILLKVSLNFVIVDIDDF